MPEPRTEKLAAFVEWAQTHLTGDEKGEAHIFLDHLFQAFGQPGSLEIGEHEFHVYDFETQMDSPVGSVALADLPEHYGPLAFLFPGQPKPAFDNDRVAVTRDCFLAPDGIAI
jgi:hypothetical protein